MIFGPRPVGEAGGTILAHSVQVGGRRLRKGTVLDDSHLDMLTEAGIDTVTVAVIEPDDVGEDAAAARIADRMAASGLQIAAPFSGRANIVAGASGVLRVDAALVDLLNRIDPAITLATLPDYTRVAKGMMIGTVKIIPYGVSGAHVAAAEAVLDQSPFQLATPRILSADLILTKTEALTDKALAKGQRVVEERLAALGVRLDRVQTVPHDTGAVADALAATCESLVLVLGASATSDPLDTCPAAVVAAGGALLRFGMPVDPGNLLFLGQIGGRHVIGLPGCARSPALNGADWVLERIVCGIPVGSDDIAAMGVGGLLKEIPVRPQPRAIAEAPTRSPVFEVLLLAAGASRRMAGRDKLLEDIDGEPLLRRCARSAMASGASAVRVILPPDAELRRAAMQGLDVDLVEAPLAHLGMAESLKAGLAHVDSGAQGAIVMLGDMPEITANDLDRLIAAFDVAAGHEICRGVSQDGRPGHPVLFGRRFFENLGDLSGDAGARAMLTQWSDFVVDVPLAGQAAVTDLDTPEDWAAWRARRAPA